MREALEQGGRSGSAGADPDRLEAEVTARLRARFTALRWLRLSRLALRDLGDIGARVAAGNPRPADARRPRLGRWVRFVAADPRPDFCEAEVDAIPVIRSRHGARDILRLMRRG
jgi:plasmid stabilization system protein ParE